jgi:hypothetical protein
MGLNEFLFGKSTRQKLQEAQLERAALDLKMLKQEDKDRKRLRDTIVELGVENEHPVVQLSTVFESLVSPEKYRKSDPGLFGAEQGGLPPFAVDSPTGAFMPGEAVVQRDERAPVDPDIVQQIAQKQFLGRVPSGQDELSRMLAKMIEPHIAGEPTPGAAPAGTIGGTGVTPQDVLEGALFKATGARPEKRITIKTVDAEGNPITQLVGEKSGTVFQEFPGFVAPETVTVTTPAGAEERVKLDKEGRPIAAPVVTKPPARQRRVKVTDLQKYRHPVTGEPPRIGITEGELEDEGYTVTTGAEGVGRERAAKAETALNIVDSLDTMADDLFPADQTGLWGRIQSGAFNTWNQLSQDDPKVAEYESFKGGVVSLLIKALGEAGTLSEGDNARAMNLLPKLFPVPDTRATAMGKLRNLRGLLESIAGKSKTEQAAMIRAALDSGAAPAPVDELEPTHRFNPATGKVEAIK